jgi:tetratricopeptide (TPR) repeat protein
MILFDNDPELLNERSTIYYGLQDYRKGIADLNRAISMSDDHIYYNNRGLMYRALRDYKNAHDDFSSAIIKSNLQIALYFNNRAGVFISEGDLDKALIDLNQAIQIDGTDSEIYGSRGNVHLKLENYSNAFEDFKVALQLNPNDNLVKLYISFILFKMKEYATALLFIDKVLEFDPKNIEAIKLRGKIKFAQHGSNTIKLSECKKKYPPNADPV